MEGLDNDLNQPSGPALVQISKSAANLLKVSAKSKKTAAIAPAMMAMVQTFQDKYADQSAVKRVIELFIDLRANAVAAN